jgi:hypothetical protein
MGPLPGEEPDHYWATGWGQPPSGQQGRERPALWHAISSSGSPGNVSAAKEARCRAAPLADGGGGRVNEALLIVRGHTDRG